MRDKKSLQYTHTHTHTCIQNTTRVQHIISTFTRKSSDFKNIRTRSDRIVTAVHVCIMYILFVRLRTERNFAAIYSPPPGSRLICKIIPE